MSPQTFQRLLLGICGLLLATRCQADILIDSYSDATNDRFSNNPAFIASSFNLSGIGQTSGGLWATAISNNVVISANHFAPSGTVYFYPGNDPDVAPVTRQIVSGQVVGSTDIWVGVLDQPLPNSISSYAIADQTLTGIPQTGNTIVIENAGLYQNLNAYMFGRSLFNENLLMDNRFVYNDQAVGRNLVTGYTENIVFNNSDNDALIFNRDPMNGPDYVQYEALFQGGDSGGPTFADIGGQLVLLGTNAFIADDSSASGINYVGNQAAAIQSYIQFNAVPEPNAFLLIAFSFATLVAGSRRRNIRLVIAR